MNENKSINSLKKQLVAAVAMVCVAAVALGSSTYAWFANNNKVEASGLSVTAQAEGGIEIKAISGTQSMTRSADWSTAANAQMNKTVLYPASTCANLASNSVLISDWYHASAASAKTSTALDGSYAKLGTVSDKCTFTNGVENGNGMLKYSANVKDGKIKEGAYYIAATYNIAYVGSQATNLKVTGVAVTGGTDGQKDFDKSLRVAIVIGDKIALYAPVGYDTQGVSYKVAEDTDGTPMELKTATMPTDANVTALAASKESVVLANTVGAENNPTVANIYVWYEGEDQNHTTQNLGSTPDDLNITVTFGASL